MKGYVIMMAGLPGTGKTYVAEKLSKNLKNYSLFSQNQIRRDLKMKKMPKTQEDILRKIDRLTMNALISGKGVIFDSVNRYSFRRQQIYGIASGCGTNAIILECVCSEKEAKKRIRKRPKGDGLISDPCNPKVYDKLARLWENIEYDFKYPGTDFVSYIIFDTQKLELKKEKISVGRGLFINKIEKILLEK